MKTFNFFLVVAGLLVGGIVTLMRDSGNTWIIATLGFALSMLCLLFWHLDHRNHVLVRNGEAAIKFLDSQHELPTTADVPHVLCIFAHDDFKRRGESRSLFRKGYFSYSKVIRYVYGLFAFLGIFFAVLPFVTTKQPPPPLAVQIQNLPAPATPTPVPIVQSTPPQPPPFATPNPTTAVFSLIGLVVGAVLQFLFTRHLDNKKHQRDLRAKAYADYLQCVSEHANLGHQKSSTEGRQLGAKTADAKCRISLYGAPAVISAFATFERLGATMNTNGQRGAFTDMVAKMRHDVLGSSSVAQADLEAVLLGVVET